MARLLDRTGQIFGRLTALECVQGGKDSKWLCRCECGSIVSVFSTNLKSGGASSCGCLRREQNQSRLIKHGNAVNGKPTKTYRTWIGLRERCNNKDHKQWLNYGGRGIAVCERWNTFENFLADMGEKPPGLTIERVDNDRGYEPGNCIWATTAVQARNRRNTLRITVCGREMTIRDACVEYHLNCFTVYSSRITRGVTSIEAFLDCLESARKRRDPTGRESGCDKHG